ncbi:MAG: RHS repeat-associated core domain-containing protein, partial [Chitinispirillaceae bacterium]
TRQRYQLGNHLGSASLELDESSNVISYEEYHPFGTTSFRSADGGAEVSAKRYRYTGKELDDETGLYYYGARYYAAWLGRWTGCDPKVEDGWNLYVYVRGNPVNLADPDGRESDRKDVGVKFPEGIDTADDMKSYLNSGGIFEYEGKKYTISSEGPLNVEMVDGIPKFSGENLMAHEVENQGQKPSESLVEESEGDTVGEYVSKSIKSALMGDFSGEQTALSIGINIAVGFTPVGIAADVRDILGSASKCDLVGVGFAALGVIPLFGDAAKGLRGAAKVSDAAKSTGKSADAGAARGTQAILAEPKHIPNAGGKIRSFVSQKDEVYYRVFSGNNKVGSFLTKVPPKNRALAIEGLSLPSANQAEFIQEVLVPGGTRLQRSRALPAFRPRGGLEQFELLEYIPVKNFRTGVPFK